MVAPQRYSLILVKSFRGFLLQQPAYIYSGLVKILIFSHLQDTASCQDSAWLQLLLPKHSAMVKRDQFWWTESNQYLAWFDGLITDRVVRYCCQNKDISEIKTSNNPVKKTTACPLAGVSRWPILSVLTWIRLYLRTWRKDCGSRGSAELTGAHSIESLTAQLICIAIKLTMMLFCSMK